LLAAQKFAGALEAIPSALAKNAGLDSVDAVTEIRASHIDGRIWNGVDAKHSKISDMYLEHVIEPLAVKQQMVKSATEAANLLLRIDQTISKTRKK
jgi:chaperonin GroEL (HSP60 family)